MYPRKKIFAGVVSIEGLIHNSLLCIQGITSLKEELGLGAAPLPAGRGEMGLTLYSVAES